jgi:peroxin-6
VGGVVAQDSRWEAQRREAVCAAGVVVTAEDIEAGIDKVSSHRASNISAPNIPNIQVMNGPARHKPPRPPRRVESLADTLHVKWEDVGGLAHVKREILDTIQLPLNRPDLFSGDLRKRCATRLTITPLPHHRRRKETLTVCPAAASSPTFGFP